MIGAQEPFGRAMMARQRVELGVLAGLVLREPRRLAAVVGDSHLAQ